ncbi:MAG: Fe-S cluster assembly protein SufD [bacterium]
MENTSIQAGLKEYLVNNFNDYHKLLNGISNTFFGEAKKEYFENLKVGKFPTLKTEEWKYTNINAIVKDNFIPVGLFKQDKISGSDVNKYFFTSFDSIKLVFVNGVFDEKLSDLTKVPNDVVIKNLNKALLENKKLVEVHFNKLVKKPDLFNVINNTFANDGLFIYVPKGKVVELPVQVLFLSGNENEKVLSLPRNMVFADTNSELNLIVNYHGYGKSSYLNNVLTEVFVDDDARVNIYTVQDENENAFHIEKTEVYQRKRSIFSNYTFTFGGKIIRNDIGSDLQGENIECHYFGLSLGKGEQHIDNHTFVDHAKPNCMSNELYKGILDDRSHGVFAGKILVQRDAQKTNAYQSNKTVLLTKQAIIDTQPQLEIFADDVKCSHGATVGQLDANAYFYIRSRGVSENLAKSMLIRAFATDVMENVKIEGLRNELNHKIFEHLQQTEI